MQPIPDPPLLPHAPRWGVESSSVVTPPPELVPPLGGGVVLRDSTFLDADFKMLAAVASLFRISGHGE